MLFFFLKKRTRRTLSVRVRSKEEIEINEGEAAVLSSHVLRPSVERERREDLTKGPNVFSSVFLVQARGVKEAKAEESHPRRLPLMLFLR